jgi:hypothetical protein
MEAEIGGQAKLQNLGFLENPAPPPAAAAPPSPGEPPPASPGEVDGAETQEPWGDRPRDVEMIPGTAFPVRGLADEDEAAGGLPGHAVLRAEELELDVVGRKVAAVRNQDGRRKAGPAAPGVDGRLPSGPVPGDLVGGAGRMF